MRLSLHIKVIAITLLLCAAGEVGASSEITWTGAGTDTLWSTPGNWSPAQIPGAGDLVYLPDHSGARQITTLDTNQTIGSLNVKLVSGTGSHVIDLGGNTLQINYGIDLNSPNYFVLPQNGTLQLGSAEHPASLRWANGPGRTFDGLGVMMGPATRFDAVLSSLVIADSAASGQGYLWGGDEGAITVGSLSKPGRFVVGRSVDAWTFNAGEIHLESQSELNATVDRFVVGESVQGLAFGSIWLAETNHIDAQEIIIGVGQTADGYLYLGQTNTLAADRMEIGTVAASGSLLSNTWYEGSTIAIGSAERPTTLIVGRRDIDEWQTATKATVDLTNAQVDAHFQDVTVGHNAGGDFGSVEAKFIGGSSGTVTVGSVENPANMIVGWSTSAGGGALGTVDLRAQSQFTAHLENLHVGLQSAGGAYGTLQLAHNNLIEAKNISVGSTTSSGWASGWLTLGEQTTILADTISIGTGELMLGSIAAGGQLGGRVDVVPAATVQIGTPTQWANLVLGNRETTSYPDLTPIGELSLETANVTAYFDQVTIGGGLRGQGSFVSGSSGLINANQILLAEGEQSRGEFVLNGGTLRAQQILRGEGQANFSWLSGRLDVREFGMDLISKNYGPSTLVVDGPTVINGDLQLDYPAKLEINLGHGSHLQVNGSANVWTEIEILANDGFEPVSGQLYTLIEGSHLEGFNIGTPQQIWVLGDYFLSRYQQSEFEGRFDVVAYRYGDANLDNFTDGVDYTIWADNYLATPRPYYPPWAGGDFTGNGWVDGADYVVWADHFSVAAPAVSVSAVPEPSTLLLGLVGCLLALGATCRRKRRLTFGQR